jgi:hypothetical protein
MFPTGSRLAYFSGYLISFMGSIAILVLIIFFVIPDCANLGAQSGGTVICNMNMTTVYIFFLIFSAIIVFSGVRLAEILIDEKGS